LDKPWAEVREAVTVKRPSEEQATYVLALSAGRRDKEIQAQAPKRDRRLLKLGAAKKEAGRAYALVKIRLPKPDEPVDAETFTFAIDIKKLRQIRRREGHYLPRTHLPGENPAVLWRTYIQLTEVEIYR
jgi:hypothetical protein